jgi:hypothetical protein
MPIGDMPSDFIGTAYGIVVEACLCDHGYQSSITDLDGFSLLSYESPMLFSGMKIQI